MKIEAIQLTRREKQVAELLLQGWQNNEIAKELGITPRTVKFYFGSMFRRFEISTGMKRVKLAVILYGKEIEISSINKDKLTSSICGYR